MDQTPSVYALRLNRIDPVKYPLPKAEAPKPGAFAHLSDAELFAQYKARMNSTKK